MSKTLRLFPDDPIDPVALLKTAALIVASRMTKAGHLAQIVTQEHRGNCPARGGCTPACQEAADWLVAVEDYLTEVLRPAAEERRARRLG